MNEVEEAARREQDSRRPRYRRLQGLILAAALVLILAVGGVLFTHARVVRAHFLMVPADSIPGDTQLMSYAMSRGAAGYSDHCTSCHGARMNGDSSRAIPNLADNDWLYGTGRVSEIEHVILYGIRSGNSHGLDLAHMPAFATAHPYNLYALSPLTPADLEDVTTYTLSFQHPQADEAAVKRGEKVFHDVTKGNCIDCHGSDAKGDSAIGAPDLTDKIWLRGDGSRDSVQDSIAHGLSGHCPAFVAELSPLTIRAIAVYVHAAAEKAAGAGALAGRAKLE